MAKADVEQIKGLILAATPGDGSAISNQALEEQVRQAALVARIDFAAPAFSTARESLLEEGALLKGKGRGGSVRRANGDDNPGFSLEPTAPAAGTPPKSTATKRKRNDKSRSGKTDDDAQILSYRHTDKRKNNPQVGLVNEETDPATPQTHWAYDPHLDPALQFDVGRSAVEKLIDDAMASGDNEQMLTVLAELKRMGSPYLQWTGKAERTSFDIDTVSLHVHERIDPMSILAAVRKELAAAKAGKTSASQLSLFSAPFETLPLRDAIDFYKHERGWSNRLVLGDSLLVMNSLLQKESMAGQVQMIYIDPPYGIKYGSNFQPFVGKRTVQDRKDEDLTHEPEMIKAFRDTWELGVHSYLTYLRDRLLLARELLSPSGSIFVQISDENLHHVREVMEEIFGENNYLNTIPFSKTSGVTTTFLASNVDYLLWYAKDKPKALYRQLYLEKSREGGSAATYTWVSSPEGKRRGMTAAEKRGDHPHPEGWMIYKPDNITSQGNPVTEFEFRGKTYAQAWKTDKERVGLQRLGHSERLHVASNSLQYVRYLTDFPCVPVTQLWDDTQTGSFTENKNYVVQTAQKVIERCLLMTTDPGDLVLDPTCGSGTTAVAAEKWGRRWITCDTSRVAATLAKQRLMTATYDYYDLRYPHEGLRGGFIYKTVPHVTLKSIANNSEIDEIYAQLHPAVDFALEQLNSALKKHPPNETFPIPEGERKGQKLSFTKGMQLSEWEVPLEFPDSWPESGRSEFDAFHRARQAMQKRMDLSIAEHADTETLYDQPALAKDKLRITGPFTVEAVPFPSVLALDEAQQPQEADVAIARSGESARQHQWRDELQRTGIRGKGGQILRFASLEASTGTQTIHATGPLDSGERVVVSFGPEHAALEQRQVEHALREAGELFPLPKMIVFAAFTFDPEAAKDIDNLKGITALRAQMNTDLLTEDLKKARSSNQSFWLMGQPDVDVRKLKDGSYEVEVNGFDYFDTVKGELVSGGKAKIAMWLLDTDYDDRSLFPRQVFFPMAGKDEGWRKLKASVRGELDESLLHQYHGTVSLPFSKGDNGKVAVKIVDDRGIESLKIIPLS